MIVMKKALPRRTFLRGIGTTLALPLLDAMVPAMAATRLVAKPAVRLAFVYVPNGIIQANWLPSAEGVGFDFASTMKPLESFRDRLNVLSGLAQVSGRALGRRAGRSRTSGRNLADWRAPQENGGC